MVTLYDFIHRLKLQNYLVKHNKQYYGKALHSSFHLNGHTLGFHPQTQISEQFIVYGFPDLAAFQRRFQICLHKMPWTKENYNRFLSVGCSSEEFVQHQKKKTTTKNKNTLSKTQRDVSLLKKYLVSRSEPRELENIDTRDLDVLIANFLLQSKERRRTIIRAHIAEVCDVLRLNFCKCIFCSARPYSFFDDDLGCAARFAIAIKFSFGSTFCDFLLLICATLRKLFQ